MKSLFSLRSCTFPECRPKSKIRLRKHRPSISSKVQKTRPKRRSKPTDNKPVSKVRIAELLTVLFSLRKLPKEVDTDTSEQVNMVDVSVSEKGHSKEPFPSPTTPGFVRDSAILINKDSSDDHLEEVDDLCRSFETNLVEMIVEEGKLKDLVDVEEFLHCWKSLKSPIFVDLVCRFYGEVCEDLFSPSSIEDESNITTISE